MRKDKDVITIEKLIQKASTRIDVYSEQIEQLEELKHSEYRSLNGLLKELNKKTGGNLNGTNRTNEKSNGSKEK